MSISLETPVGQLVVEKPIRARIFQQFQIDFCCHGDHALGDACNQKNLDPQVVMAELVLLEKNAATNTEPDWTTASLTELVDNILSTHHEYLHKALPHLGEMAEKVYTVHGENHPELQSVVEVFSELISELSSHMYKEENILFPLIKQLDRGLLPPEAAAHLLGPINVMEAEHKSAGQALERLRALTQNYSPPEDACNTFRGLYAGLEELETDLHWHIHKENNILFPRALA